MGKPIYFVKIIQQRQDNPGQVRIGNKYGELVFVFKENIGQQTYDRQVYEIGNGAE